MIVSKTDPPLLSLIAAPVAALRSIPYVNWLQDLFPEVVTGIGMGSGRLASTTPTLAARLATTPSRRCE